MSRKETRYHDFALSLSFLDYNFNSFFSFNTRDREKVYNGVNLYNIKNYFKNHSEVIDSTKKKKNISM
jgi:hypothetical protein